MRAKKIILSLSVLCLIWTAPSYAATTYYVRPDGGTATQCTGKTDAPYSGSGTAQACAFKHPFWAIAPIGNNPTKMVGGDTLIIDGSQGIPYVIGLGAPNTTDTAKCHSSWPWDCQMRPVPSGPSATAPTRILGKGWNTGCTKPPQLYGRERQRQIFNLTRSSNVEMQCLEITDHSDCMNPPPSGSTKGCDRSSYPYGDWSDWGIIASDSSNVLLKNVNIHGLAHGGIYAGRLKDWTLDSVKIVANGFVGWDGDIGADVSSNSGTISFNKTTIAYNGCGETYPGKTPYSCFSQSQTGYGDGIGTAKTGGNWIFTNSDVSHNTSDGIDLLYHNGLGTISINRVRAEGNAGNQIKTSTNTTIANSIIIGNCTYFRNNPITFNSATFDHCRAFGNALSVNFRAGVKVSITNSTILSNGDGLILSSGSGCNGTESLYSRNNIFLGRPDYNGGDVSGLYYASGATGNGDGACAAVKLNDDYSIIYGTKYLSSDCTGKAHSKCVDPKMTEPLVSYYTGNAYRVAPQSISPARNMATVLTGASSLDYNNFNRGSTWDIGAWEYGSVPSTPAPAPSTTPTCGNGKLDTGEACDGSLLGGKTCTTQGFTGGTLSCSSTCTLNTASCTKTTTLCGNGKIDSGEQCDKTLLNGQTCVSRGFAGGTLACSSTCLFNTSGCVAKSSTPVCGNGIVESGEWCDGYNLNGQDCTDRGFGGGTLRCYECTYNTFYCTPKTSGTPVCGNGIVEKGEWCDGYNLNGQDCTDRGFGGGTLRCYDCTYNTFYCTAPKAPVCGNGIVEEGEWCDGYNLNGQDCTDRGFTSGTLRCYDCTYNTFYCKK
jgi:hypothetical protein